MPNYPFPITLMYRTDVDEPWAYEDRTGAAAFVDPTAVAQHVARQLTTFRMAVDGARQYYHKPKAGIETMIEQLKKYPDWIHEAEMALAGARAQQAAAKDAYAIEVSRVYQSAVSGARSAAACEKCVAADPGVQMAKLARNVTDEAVYRCKAEYDRRCNAFEIAKREQAAEASRLQQQPPPGDVVNITEQV